MNRWIGPAACAVLAACGLARPALPVPECRMARTAAAPARLPDLSGDYRLTLVGTHGRARGKIAAGTLRLRARMRGEAFIDPSGERIVLADEQPYVGTAAIDLDGIGALFEGVLDSTEPSAPGVVIASNEAASAGHWEMRFGSEGNRYDVISFDDSGTTARLRRLGSGGFSGDWFSYLSYTTYHPGGWFCAERIR